MDTNQALQAAMAAAAGEPPPLPIVLPHYHWLLRLPPIFWSRMHLYLDYIDILNLSLLSSEFRNERVEKYLPWTIRHAIVEKWDRENQVVGPDPRTGDVCYLCFRIKNFEEFQKPLDTVMYARVLQRDAYTGRRLLAPVAPPSPGQIGNIVQPPPIPASPTSMGGFGAVRAGFRGMNIAVSGIGAAASGAVATHRQVAKPWSMAWVPRAPGAEVGQIESLRRYCIDCSIETHLSIPGDQIITQPGQKLWVCHCRVAHKENVDFTRCPTCNMPAVYRT